MEKWYVRNTEGKVFGPIDLTTLVTWTKDGRVEPLAGLSTDLKHWVLTPQKPELEMDWIIENTPGQFYGPVHRALIDTWVQAGTLSPEARFYQDGRAAARTAAAATEEARASCSRLQSERDTLKAEHKQTADALAAARADNAHLAEQCRTLEKTAAQTAKDLASARADATETEKRNAQLSREIARLEKEKSELAAESTRLKDELAKHEEKQARDNKIHARAWETEVLVPEIIHETPRPVTPAFFNPPAGPASGGTPSLADLERQAQAELARMGATGAKSFFTRRK